MEEAAEETDEEKKGGISSSEGNYNTSGLNSGRGQKSQEQWVVATEDMRFSHGMMSRQTFEKFPFLSWYTKEKMMCDINCSF